MRRFALILTAAIALSACASSSGVYNDPVYDRGIYIAADGSAPSSDKPAR